MKPQQLRGIVLLVLIIMSAAIYRTATTPISIEPDLKQAQILYELEKIRLKQETLQRNDLLMYYGAISFLTAICASLMVISGGYARAKIRAASVLTARIGAHSEIPVHYKDLQHFYPIAVNLSLAEIEASVSTSHEKAYHILRQMIDDITQYTRSLAGQRGLVHARAGALPLQQAESLALNGTPTFADLIRTGMAASGKPLILGYDRQGQPQYRSLHDLKSLAIAGLQGSGKTLSTAYLVASSVLAYSVQVYVIDPHKHHPEGLYALIHPLEKTGCLSVINPFDTPAFIRNLDQILDRRLAGNEPSEPGILLVIDELARLAKMDCFDILIAFLERCTEETRKANITFIGGSHKWTARHFKGRADIRGCMNSMLIHKTKPSQADLLLEDAHDKNLVKQLHRPGDAILVTDYSDATVISVPFCTRADMETVAELAQKRGSLSSPESRAETPVNQPENSPEISMSAPKETLREVISFEASRKKYQTPHQWHFEPKHLTVEMILEEFHKRKEQDASFSQAELARLTDISPSVLSKIFKQQRPLKDDEKTKLYRALFANQPGHRNFLHKPHMVCHEG